jgi:hypothetical protein
VWEYSVLKEHLFAHRCDLTTPLPDLVAAKVKGLADLFKLPCDGCVNFLAAKFEQEVRAA